MWSALLAVNAEARRHELKVGEFTTLRVMNDMDVICKCMSDSAGYVCYECPEEDTDAVMFEIGGQKLNVMISPDFIGKSERVPLVCVYTDSLNFIESSSAGRVRIENLPDLKRFKAVLMDNGRLEIPDIHVEKLIAAIATGSGTIDIKGTAGEAVYKLVGTGHIKAHELVADKIICHVFGGGDIFCYPKNQIVLKGLGTTRVYYRGTPGKVKKSGLGKLLPLDSNAETYLQD